MKNYDLHTHTVYSDGEYTPRKLINQAKEKGLKYLAITDHNNIEGSKFACSLNEAAITIIPGVEIEGEHTGKLHILGYNIDLNNENLNYTLNLMKKKRHQRVLTIIEELRKYGITLPTYEVNNLMYKKGDIGKPQIAKVLVKYEYADSIQDAFNHILNERYIHIPKKDYILNKEQVIRLIKDAGGIPVLAHYKTLNLEGEALTDFIEELISLGLMGIETEHSCFNSAQHELAKQIADKYHLLETGGSDFHGPNIKNDIDLASWYHKENDENSCSMLTFLEKKQKIKKI